MLKETIHIEWFLEKNKTYLSFIWFAVRSFET